MVKWGTAATGSFFRTLYNGGIWLSREEAQVAVENGWNSTDPKLEIKLVKAVESLSLVFFPAHGLFQGGVWCSSFLGISSAVGPLLHEA